MAPSVLNVHALGVKVVLGEVEVAASGDGLLPVPCEIDDESRTIALPFELTWLVIGLATLIVDSG